MNKKYEKQIIERIEEWVKQSLEERTNLVPIYDVKWLLKRVKKLREK